MKRAIAVVVIFIGSLSGACFEHGGSHVVLIDNQTGSELTMFVAGINERDIPPNHVTRHALLRLREPTEFTFRDQSGIAVLTMTLSWEELNAQSWTINIPSRPN